MRADQSPPSFWTPDVWSEFWGPDPSASHVWDLSGCTPDFQAEWNNVQSVLQAMRTPNGKPVSVSAAKNVARRLAEWSSSPATEQFLTVPATQKGFQEALRTACMMDIDAPSINRSPLIILAQLRSADVFQALQECPPSKLSSNWQILQRPAAVSVAVQSPAPAVHIQAPSPVPQAPQNTTAQVPQNSTARRGAPRPAREEQRWTLAQQATASRFREMLAEVTALDSPPAIKREAWDKAIKHEIASHKGAGPTAANYWFEDIAFPGLCALSATELSTVLDLWPPHAKVTWNNPAQTMGSPLFWSSIRSLKGADRVVMLEQVLPTLVDSETWLFKDRQAMLAPMLEKTKEHGWLFEERLKLWCAWGGDLDMEGAVDSNDDSLLSAPVQSARQWIEDHGISAWSDIMAREHPNTKRPSRHP